MIPGDGAGGTPAPRPGDGRATHTSPGIEPTAQTKGSELLCQVSLSITRFRTLPGNDGLAAGDGLAATKKASIASISFQSVHKDDDNSSEYAYAT